MTSIIDVLPNFFCIILNRYLVALVINYNNIVFEFGFMRGLSFYNNGVESHFLSAVERSLDASSIFPKETITYAGRYATLTLRLPNFHNLATSVLSALRIECVYENQLS